MSFANKLKETRKSKGFSQKELAFKVGVDQSRISAYEAGDDIPNDVAMNIIQVLNSPRLSLEYSSQMKSDVINMPTLNNVNEDVVNVLDVVMEEAEEVIDAGKKLKKLIRNKTSREDFTDFEFEEVLKLEEQVADLMPCLRLHFVVMAEVFDMNIERLEKRMIMKFKKKKLIV